MAWRDWRLLAAVVLLALAAAALALRPPGAKPANAPPAAFSAGRAMIDIAVIAQRPHPAGSPEAARVRAVLDRRLGQLKLSPIVRTATVRGRVISNLIGVLPGLDPGAPAVLIMSHYDSVAAGPGAADDGAGVASALEIIRALKADGPHRRDVIVLFTDGEEIDLLGARAFFADDPLADHAGFVLNLEARGDQGRAVMFETQRRAGGLIGWLVGNHALWGASSLMPDLYRRLPNNTDLTPALNAGRPGLNFAFFAGVDAYHRSGDTVQRLNPGSVQSLGDQGLAAARTLVDAPNWPGEAPDRVYGDVLGGPILHYPPALGWLILLISAAGAAAASRGAARIGGTLIGAAAFLGLGAGLGVMLYGLGAARSLLTGGHGALLLHHADATLVGLALAAAGLSLIVVTLMMRRLGAAAAQGGALWAALGLAGLLQAAAPLDAFILAWPIILASAGLAAASAVPSGAARVIAAPFAAVALAQLLYGAGLMFALAGAVQPAALTPFALLAALALGPLIPQGRGGARLGLGLWLTGAGLALACAFI